MSSSVCSRSMAQAPPKEPGADCALGKKMRKIDDNDIAKGVIQPVNQPSGLESTGPLPNEIFELLNEFWRPGDVLAADQHMMNGKRRNDEISNGDDQIEDDKAEPEDDLTSIAEQEQDMSQDRGTSKRRYSRLSDGYERLKTVLPSVKDKRRVSKARILDEAINYIQRLESITNVLKREHEKRLQMLNGGANGFFTDYSVQPPYMRSIFPKQMYHQSMATKMTPYSKINGAIQSPSKANPRLKQPFQYSNTGGQGIGNTTMSPDYSYQSLNAYSNNNNNSMYTSDPNQMMNDDASPIANTSPYNNSACSLSPGTPTSYQNGTVNNSWPYHQAPMNSFSDTTSTQLLSHGQSRQASAAAAAAAGYASSNTYATLTNGMWNGIGLGDSSSQVVPHAEHSMKVG